MPDMCSVPGCNSSNNNTNKYPSVFKFPKDLSQKELWLTKIPQDNWIQSLKSRVCLIYFNDSDIIREDEVHDRNGTIIEIPCRYPKLKAGAYPCILPNLAHFLSGKKKKHPKRKSERKTFKI